MLELILAVGLALFVSAFCSVSEAALYSMPWSAIERLKQQGDRRGRLLESMRHNIEEPITAILTLNTVAHTAGAAVAGSAWAALYGKDTLWAFTLAFTVAVLIFTEILPKTLGVFYSRQIGSALAVPLRLLVLLFLPVVRVMGRISSLVRKKEAGTGHTEDDIRAMVSLTKRAGMLKPYEEQSIQNILNLDTKTVEEIMTPRTVVFSLPAEMTVSEARQAHHTWPHSRFPAYGEDTEDVVGVVYRRQVFEALANDQDDLRLADLMRPVRFVLENVTLDKLLIKFLGSRMHMFVVLDEYGGIAGVVTLEDVLEEILGSEIVDETDEVVDMRELARRQRNELAKDAAARGNGGKQGNGSPG